jgi:hypothetical protein
MLPTPLVVTPSIADSCNGTELHAAAKAAIRARDGITSSTWDSARSDLERSTER